MSWRKLNDQQPHKHKSWPCVSNAWFALRYWSWRNFLGQRGFFETYVTQGIAAHPELHDAKSPEKIWCYVQRAHFHATGIAAFSIGLLLLGVAILLANLFLGLFSERNDT